MIITLYLSLSHEPSIISYFINKTTTKCVSHKNKKEFKYIFTHKDAQGPEKRKFLHSFQTEHMYELNVFTSTLVHTCWHKGTKGTTTTVSPPPNLCFTNSLIAPALHSTKVKVYVASSNDPLFNIATEEWLFREGSHSDQQTLYLWRNSPTVRMNAAAIHEDFFVVGQWPLINTMDHLCQVVIGRHQNPFKECHLQAMEQDNVVLARRYSGGGAVYQVSNVTHDLVVEVCSSSVREWMVVCESV